MIDGSTGQTLTELRDATAADLRQLAEIAGLDPELDFRNVDLAGVDFGTSDLNGFNFTESDLTGSNLSRAKTQGAIFDRATVDGVKWPLRRHRLRLLRGVHMLWAFQQEVASHVKDFARSAGRIPSLLLAMPPGSGRHTLLNYLLDSFESSGLLLDVLVITDSLVARDAMIHALTDAFGSGMVIAGQGQPKRSRRARIQVSTIQAVSNAVTGKGRTVLSDNVNLIVTFSRGIPQGYIKLFTKYWPKTALISLHDDLSLENEQLLKMYDLNFRYAYESAVKDGILDRARVIISDDESVLSVIRQQSLESHGAIIFHSGINLADAAKFIGGQLHAAGLDWRLITVDAETSYQPRTAGTITLAKVPFAENVDWGSADFLIAGTKLPLRLKAVLEYPSARPDRVGGPIIYDFSDSFLDIASPFASTRQHRTGG